MISVILQAVQDKGTHVFALTLSKLHNVPMSPTKGKTVDVAGVPGVVKGYRIETIDGRRFIVIMAVVSRDDFKKLIPLREWRGCPSDAYFYAQRR